MKKALPVLVWGASGQAEVVTDILGQSDTYQIKAYVDDVNISGTPQTFNGIPVVHNDFDIRKLQKSGLNLAIIAVGNIAARVSISKRLLKLGFKFINAIDHTSIISKRAKIGINNVIKPGVIIDPMVEIGNHTYVGAGVTIAHHSQIGNFVNIAGGSNISGHVVIEDKVYIGTGTVIKDRVLIGKESIIGAGAVVVTNIPPQSVAIGVPAKPTGKKSANK